jgi:hypothetical protein
VNPPIITRVELVLNAVLITFADGSITLIQNQQIYDLAVSEEVFLKGLPGSDTFDHRQAGRLVII